MFLVIYTLAVSMQAPLETTVERLCGVDPVLPNGVAWRAVDPRAS